MEVLLSCVRSTLTFIFHVIPLSDTSCVADSNGSFCLMYPTTVSFCLNSNLCPNSVMFSDAGHHQTEGSWQDLAGRLKEV